MAEEREEEAAAAGQTVVRRMIERATDSTEREVEPRLLGAIKSAVRSSDEELRSAVGSLMDHLKKNHSQVRYLAVLITDELFMRSKLFRSLLVVNFDQFLSLSVGFRSNMPLPPPASIASLLRSKSIELLEKWNASFGIHYRQLRLGFDYLKNTLRYQFPNRLENAARLQQERRDRENRSKQILLDKFENLKDNYSSMKVEIQSTIDEIEQCLEIVSVKEEEDFTYNFPTEDDGLVEFKSLALQQIRLDSLKEGEKIQENSDNKAIFDALRELHKLLVSKHLSTVQDWISVLIRVDLTDNKFRDSALKEFIDLLNVIKSVKKRCSQLGWALDVNPIPEEEEEDLWEEGKIGVYTPETSNASKSSGNGSEDAPSTRKGKGVATSDRSKPSDKKSSTSPRAKLMAEAPVVTWGPFLDNWGSNRDALANQRGLELDGHWGRVDPDAVIPAEKIAELNVHCTVYKEEPVASQPCNAPLKKGGLCQRRDLRVCPFHGPIIPRDAEGKPLERNPQREGGEGDMEVSKESSQADDSTNMESFLDMDDKVVEKLAMQAVKNVRERGREASSKKRAKLAKVREHNEAVLREAALASTSYSEHVVENAEAVVKNGRDVKGKKVTLASMLKKKVTVKDRLAQRLLSTRARDNSSRQVAQGEHSKYREAFPNQW
ncbi:UV-stimulated scaffold protein A-like protein [Iris pallida]|uniref:UV-stimulated scaffold protein A-like protein n=1 Tax=Iris pallida TaxID=29817 RepID=A0AAX6DZS4_IRIPA|nr:UV-stimulated scaffold protein A-like protein [Iris pallida]